MDLGKSWREDSGEAAATLLAPHPPELHIQLVLLPRGTPLLQPLGLGLHQLGVPPPDVHQRQPLQNLQEHFPYYATALAVASAGGAVVKEKKEKDYTFRRLFDEKPGKQPGCPDAMVHTCCH